MANVAGACLRFYDRRCGFAVRAPPAPRRTDRFSGRSFLVPTVFRAVRNASRRDISCEEKRERTRVRCSRQLRAGRSLAVGGKLSEYNLG